MYVYVGLLTSFCIIELVLLYVYKTAMRRLQENTYRNIEMAAVAIEEEEKEEKKEETIDPEEIKAFHEGQILVPEPEITMYYEL
jgi:hypothetical protein